MTFTACVDRPWRVLADPETQTQTSLLHIQYAAPSNSLNSTSLSIILYSAHSPQLLPGRNNFSTCPQSEFGGAHSMHLS